MTTMDKNKPDSGSIDYNVSQGSVRSAYSLIALQVLSRIATFTLNQLLLRLATPKVFGTAAIQLDLLLSTVLFISREGVRNTILRVPRHDLYSPKVVNVSTLPVLLGAPLAFLITVGYRAIASNPTRAQPYFDLAVSIYAIAAIVDLLSEPLHNRAQGHLQPSLRVKAEGTAIVCRSVFTVGALYVAGEQWALVAFAGGQLAYAITVLASYVRSFSDEPGAIQLLPRRIDENGRRSLAFDSNSFKLALTMTGQSIFKHFLTEGDRIVISRVSPLEDQGGYAIASNYGSLVARILFQPIEESSRLYFSKTLASSHASKELQASHQPSKQNLIQAATTLQSILFLHSYLALGLTTLLPPLIPFLSAVLLPPKYRSTAAPRILRVYCAYIPAMGANGILEAFVHATATPAELRIQARWMILFSLVFVGGVTAGASGVLGVQWDDTMLVWANVINLGARAIYGWVYTRQYFMVVPRLVAASNVRPSIVAVLAFGTSGMIVRWSEVIFDQAGARIKHIGICVGCGIVSLLVGLWRDRRRFMSILDALQSRRKTD